MEIFSAGSDWYTATNVLADNPTDKSLFVVFHELSSTQKRWRAGGYKGHECLVSGIKYGSRIRKDGKADEIFIASGEASVAAIEYVGDVSRFRTTRFDLQVTWHFKEADPSLATDLYDKIKLMESVGASPLGNRKMSLVRSGTGDTLYVGSRSSKGRFFRLYDKSFDLGYEPGTYWRSEVQYGSKVAKQAIGWYIALENEKSSIVSLVCSEFWEAMEWCTFAEYDYTFLDKADEPDPETELDGKLAWLKTCVRPTIALLIENGLEKEARAALGLPSRDVWKGPIMHRGRPIK